MRESHCRLKYTSYVLTFAVLRDSIQQVLNSSQSAAAVHSARLIMNDSNGLSLFVKVRHMASAFVYIEFRLICTSEALKQLESDTAACNVLKVLVHNCQTILFLKKQHIFKQTF